MADPADPHRVPLHLLPSVGRTLETPEFRVLVGRFGAVIVTEVLREEIDRLRARAISLHAGEDDVLHLGEVESLARAVELHLRRLEGPAPRPVINATGVVVHTNLGRSLLSDAAARRVAEAARQYVDLEYDLREGRRGSRLTHLEPLLDRLFPGASSLAVNNNASAIFLALHALTRGREVVISRGELVEIGGSFRVPEILTAAGARLREVGTTNRTRVADYDAAIGPRTALLLKVHTSNFRIVGFTEEASVAELAALGRRRNVPLMVDWGSGDLVDLAALGIRDEVPVRRILEEGADLVTFSGDKLLGGPQAGIAVGREDLITRMRRDPVARVVRLDRLLVAALRETLWAYLRGNAFSEIPTLRMLALEPEALERRALRVLDQVAAATGAGRRLTIVEGVSRTGGGSSPSGERPTRLLQVDGASGDASRLERELRLGDPPILGRLHEGRLLLDFRTVLEAQDNLVAGRLAVAIEKEALRR